MSLADTIITLQDGNITEIGSPSTLLKSSGYISKLGLSLDQSENEVALIPDIKDPVSAPSGEESGLIDENEIIHTDLRRKNGDISVYKYYLTNAGSVAVGLYVVSVVIWIFCTEFSSKFNLLLCPLLSTDRVTAVWIKRWSEANTLHPNKNVGMYMGIYAMFGLLGTLGVFMAAW